MSFSEDWDSYYEDDTVEGWNVTRVFTALWTDWVSGYGFLVKGNIIIDSNWELPIVGDELAGRPELVVSHRNAVALSNSILDCKITITYSTETTESRSQSADQIASWEEELDVQIEESTLQNWVYAWGTAPDGEEEKFYQNTWMEWDGFFKALGPRYVDKDGKPAVDKDGNPLVDTANIPEWTRHTPRVVYNISGYGSAQYITRILEDIGKVNSDRFIQSIASEKALVLPDLNDDVGDYDDRGKWLFSGCRRRRVKKSSYQYSFTFIYDGDGWNTMTVTDEIKKDVYQNRKVHLGLYKEFVMRDLLIGMDSIDTDFWAGART